MRVSASLLMNKAVRLRSTRRAGQRSFGVRQPRWRFRCPPAAELDGEDAQRSWARPKAGLRPAVQKARAQMLDMSHRFFSRLEERDAVWGTQNDTSERLRRKVYQCRAFRFSAGN